MKISLMVLFLAFLSLQNARAADSPEIQISKLGDQVMRLGERMDGAIEVRAGSEKVDVDLNVDSSRLGQEGNSGDILFSVSPSHLSLKPGQSAQVKVEIRAKTSAPSFDAGAVSLVAREDGKVEGRSDFLLTIKPEYIIYVLDGDPFNFSSSPQTEYFRPHTEGLQVTFRNLSSQSCVIHGEGAVPHQDLDDSLPPAKKGADGKMIADPKGDYVIPRIYPADGPDLQGRYTIHEVYHPYRDVVFNATHIPAR